MRKILLYCICLIAGKAVAQSPNDGLMMPQGQFCILGQYTNSAWENYWEGENKRSNSNLGTVTTQNVMLMANYGISSKLNVMLGAPYVWTKSSASYLAGQKGVQDLSVFLKYQALETRLGAGAFKVQATGGLSTPVGNYNPDFLPFSIGMRSKTASLRGILNYTADFGLYVTAQAGHTWRGNIKLDRDYFLYNNELIYSDDMPIPNVFDYSARLGFIKPRFQAEVWYESFTGLTGDDIRYNEAPQGTNKMAASQAGVFVKYFVIKQLGILATVSQVLDGRNVGESLTWSVGATYFLDINKKEATEN